MRRIPPVAFPGFHGKEGVAGSSPAEGSTRTRWRRRVFLWGFGARCPIDGAGCVQCASISREVSLPKRSPAGLSSVFREAGLQDSDWKDFVDALVEAKRCLGHAWHVLDGTDGGAGGTEQALTAALAAIVAIYGIEAGDPANQDVAAPTSVQQFWTEHGQLPGFAVGS